jgi:hypothetical protein
MRRALRVIAICGVAPLVVAACGGNLWPDPGRAPAGATARPTAGARAGARAPTTTTTPGPAASATAANATPTVADVSAAANPVDEHDFPDPYVVSAGSGYVAFSTNSGGRHVPMMTSNDLAHWTEAGDALPEVPSWADPNSVWAPSVVSTALGSTMYVTIGDSRRGASCVFAATSASVSGPYSLRDTPLICEPGGSIDASPVRDAAGAVWLVWKDEAALGEPTRIRAARLFADGVGVASLPTTLLTSTDASVQNVEGPSVMRTGNGFTLFFSVGDWRSSSYRTGYATCTSLISACQVVSSDWLHSNRELDAPGGLEVFSVDGLTYAAFHTESCAGCGDRRRVFNVRRLVTDAAPVLS